MRMLQAKHGSKRVTMLSSKESVSLRSMAPIDFRFHMHKNSKNRWSVVGIGAKSRSGASQRISRTGLLDDAGAGARPCLRLQSSRGAGRAKDAAIAMSEAIENHHPHLLGEIGFDIGIDDNERIWMFEANSKPGRSIFNHPSLKGKEKHRWSIFLNTVCISAASTGE